MLKPIPFLTNLLGIISGFFLLASGFYCKAEDRDDDWTLVMIAGLISMIAGLMTFFA